MKPATTVRAFLTCVVVAAAIPAHALPFSVVSTPASGERGTAFTVALIDGNVTDLEATDFRLTFDANVLSYASATVGSATGSFSLVAGIPVSAGGSLMQLDFSLAANLGPVNGIAGSLVDVSFLINPVAPSGDTELAFEARPLSDYAIPRSLGMFTVSPGQPGVLPEPASGVLVVMGLFVLAAFRRWQA
jgi:hypothetical protein